MNSYKEGLEHAIRICEATSVYGSGGGCSAHSGPDYYTGAQACVLALKAVLGSVGKEAVCFDSSSSPEDVPGQQYLECCLDKNLEHA